MRQELDRGEYAALEPKTVVNRLGCRSSPVRNLRVETQCSSVRFVRLPHFRYA
jgi:hypothetical protein